MKDFIYSILLTKLNFLILPINYLAAQRLLNLKHLLNNWNLAFKILVLHHIKWQEELYNPVQMTYLNALQCHLGI